MGGSNSIEFVADQESPSGTGEVVVMSGPIDGLKPEDFWVALEKCARERKPQSKKYEVDIVRQDLPDGKGLRVGATIETSGIAAKFFKFKGTLNTVFKFPAVNNELHLHYHHLDAECKPSSMGKDFTLKLHEDGGSVRVEVKGESFKTRGSGPFLQALTEAFIKELGHTGVEVKCDAASPSCSGSLSVLSDTIPDPSLTIQKVWENRKAHMIKEDMGKEVPGEPNKLVLDKSSWLSLDGSFAILQLDEAASEITQYDYGNDETLQDLRGTTHHKLVSNGAAGPRLECWAWSVDGPLPGSEVKCVADDIVTGCMNKMQGKDE